MDGKKRYEIQLSSKAGPIDVFLIQDHPPSSSSLSTTTTANDEQTADPGSTIHPIILGQTISEPTPSSSSSLDPSNKYLLKQLEFPHAEGSGYDFDLQDHEGPYSLYQYPDVLNIFNSSSTDNK